MKLEPTGNMELQWLDGELYFCGAPVAQLAERTGTPAFIFSESRLRSNFRQLAEAFRPAPPFNLKVAYSVKSGWEPKLLRIIAGLGAGAEVACEHELDFALKAGFSSPDIFLDGPVHTREVLVRAAGKGVRFVKADSLDQLYQLAEVARAVGELGVCLRIQNSRILWLTKPAEVFGRRFGLAPEELRSALAFIASERALRFRGLAVHIGSQVTGTRDHARSLSALSSAYATAHQMGLQGQELNIGGGFPSPTLGLGSLAGLMRRTLTGNSGRAPDLDQIGSAVVEALARTPFPPSVTELVLEPGRAIVGSAAILLTRVATAKKRWLLLDASSNFVGESLLFAARRFLPARPRSGLPWKRINLAGQTLNTGDLLAIGERLPPCTRGDVLVMMDAGAYTLSRANRFTTLVPPAFLMDAQRNLIPLRKRESAGDVVDEVGSW